MSIGTTLKETREKKNLSIENAYAQTRIVPDILNALENDNYQNIPTPTYAKSFLKEYAAFLGLDVDSIMEEYNKLHAQEEKPKPHHIPQEPLPELSDKTDKPNIISSNAKPIIKWSIIALAAFLIIRAGTGLMRKNTASKKYVKEHVSVVVKEIADTRGKVAAKTVPKKGVSIPKEQNLRLTIDATDDVWMRLEIDGNVIFENILKKGSSETWQAKDNFKMLAGKADALKLTLNGNYIGTAGRGIVRDLIIDRKGIKK